MLKKMSKKWKLIIPIVILFFIFSVLIISLVQIQFSKNKSLLTAEKEIILAIKFSKVLHEVQSERGLSTGFIVSKGTRFQKELLLQRKNTDALIDNLNHFMDSNRISNGEVMIDTIKLGSMRDSIDTLSISDSASLYYFSDINTRLLNEIIEISKTPQNHMTATSVLAYSNFLYFKEYSGLERAMGTVILSNDTLDSDNILQLSTLIAKEQVYMKNFLNYVSDDTIALGESYRKKELFKKIELMRKTLLSGDKSSLSNLDVAIWYSTLTLKIDLLNVIDKHLTQEIISNIKMQTTKTGKDLLVILLLGIGSIILFILMVKSILDLIKNDRKLQSLLDKYVIRSTTDTNGIIIDVSEAFIDISGYTKDELIGQPHSIVRHPDMTKDIYAEMWKVIKTGKAWSGSLKNLKKNGTSYWVDARIEPIMDINGNIDSFVAIRQNITDKMELNKLNQELEQRVKQEVERNREKEQQIIQQSRLAQMGEMISMIAHQWRQPLTAISATSSVIGVKAKLGKLDKDAAIELSDKISKYSLHLSATIDDFREFFKSNKEKKETNYSELIQGVLAIVDASMRNQEIELILELKCEESFSTYPNELKQVILNLIKNAEDVLMEMDREKSYIKLATYKEGDDLILQVSDNGGGVPEEIIDKIFDPYFSTKIQKDGTGLGLYMSKMIVEEHCAGKLTLFNNDDGAVFEIRLV